MRPGARRATPGGRRVLFVTREGWGAPGARVRAYGFAKALAAEGIPAGVLSYPDALGARDGAREHEMGWREKVRLNLAAWWRVSRAPDAVLVVQRCHYHALAPLAAHVVNHRRLILDLDDWEVDPAAAARRRWPVSAAEALLRALARRAVLCIGASRYLVDYLQRFHRSVLYLPSAVDTSQFLVSAPPEPSRGPVRCVWVGTMHRPEDVASVALAARAVRRVRARGLDVELEVAGAGRHAEAARRAAGTDGVRWRGWVPPGQVPRYLSRMEIGLMPLVGEGPLQLAKSPVALFEYMAAGKAVVASAVGEACEIIRDGYTGCLARTEDVFADRLARVAGDRTLRERLGAAAHHEVEARYSLRTVGRRLAEALRALV